MQKLYEEKALHLGKICLFCLWVVFSVLQILSFDLSASAPNPEIYDLDFLSCSFLNG